MTKQLIQFRVCDKCPGEVEAAVTDKIMFNGSKYDLDLCERHSLELFSDMMAWADLGTKTGESSVFDRQREARAVTVKVDAPKRPVAEPEPTDVEPASAVTPIRSVIANDPDLPLTAARWNISNHANQRIELRELTLAEVLWAAERPEFSATDKTDPTLQERRRNNVAVIVNPLENLIVTAYLVDEADRKAQG